MWNVGRKIIFPTKKNIKLADSHKHANSHIPCLEVGYKVWCNSLEKWLRRFWKHSWYRMAVALQTHQADVNPRASIPKIHKGSAISLLLGISPNSEKTLYITYFEDL